jgi:hypothetical protein
MTLLTDFAGRPVRLTDERRAHLLSHPEMVALEPLLANAIASPAVVVRSRTDHQVFLYYTPAVTDLFGAKLLCVVIKHLPGDSFVITAYLTDKMKAGETIWTRP